MIQKFNSPGSVQLANPDGGLAIKPSNIQRGKLTETEYGQLKMGFDTITHLMIAKMLRATGLRIGETLKLEPRHLEFQHPTYCILIKRTKKRQRKKQPEYEPIFIPPTLGMELYHYVQGNGTPLDGPIFQGRIPGRAITVRAVEYAFERASEQAREYGLRRVIHPHEIRHLFAWYLHDNGVPVETVAKFLGHEDPKTTYQWYLDLSMDERRVVGERMPV